MARDLATAAGGGVAVGASRFNHHSMHHFGAILQWQPMVKMPLELKPDRPEPNSLRREGATPTEHSRRGLNLRSSRPRDQKLHDYFECFSEITKT